MRQLEVLNRNLTRVMGSCCSSKPLSCFLLVVASMCVLLVVIRVFGQDASWQYKLGMCTSLAIATACIVYMWKACASFPVVLISLIGIPIVIAIVIQCVAGKCGKFGPNPFM